jgi:hypothetical protein
MESVLNRFLVPIASGADHSCGLGPVLISMLPAHRSFIRALQFLLHSWLAQLLTAWRGCRGRAILNPPGAPVWPLLGVELFLVLPLEFLESNLGVDAQVHLCVDALRIGRRLASVVCCAA